MSHQGDVESCWSAVQEVIFISYITEHGGCDFIVNAMVSDMAPSYQGDVESS